MMLPWGGLSQMPADCCDYKSVESLGAGAMGHVIRARHRVGGFELAVKIAAPGKEEWLEREFKALRTFNHPNILALCPGLKSGHCSMQCIERAVRERQSHLCLELLNGANCHMQS